MVLEWVLKKKNYCFLLRFICKIFPMNDSRLQRQRFEFKYRVSPTEAISIRHYVMSYLDIDSYGAVQDDLSYPVHSLYLDSPSLKTYTDTLNGNRNRYKLRIRYYENGPNAPVYLEVKRRYDKVIAKKRAVVHRHVVQELLDGRFPEYTDLVNPGAEQFEALDYFCNVRSRLSASPRVHISYRREAYENDESNAVRVTFDRLVNSEPMTGDLVEFRTESDNFVSVFGSEVILELKFTNRFPDWFNGIVQMYGLRQQSAAKYVDGLIQLHYNNKLSLSYW
jgi:hypothetical protein